jgi:thiamine biosynthesis protein ThiS
VFDVAAGVPLTMTITLNGETTLIPDNITVLGLLEHLNVQHQRVAVELNRDLVKKDAYGATPVKEGGGAGPVQGSMF